MPTSTYTALANLTLGTAASSITFSNIPATYRDLILITSARSSTTATGVDAIFLRYNSDTGSNSSLWRRNYSR
jgi:hypothetical protein